jgi:demethoxyubiquinone hydroxylase (CLK1/Coq7/Cat5 family)
MLASLLQVILIVEFSFFCLLCRIWLHLFPAPPVRIYQGQRMVLGHSSDGPLLREMQVDTQPPSNSCFFDKTFDRSHVPRQSHEERHLAGISQAAHRHRADASVLLPVWSAAALALGCTCTSFRHFISTAYANLSGVGSALLGRQAAMACTQAVETVITQHYNDQLRQLHAMPPSPQVEEIISKVKQYRDEEQVSRCASICHSHSLTRCPTSRITTSPSKMAPTALLFTRFLRASFVPGALPPSK